MKLEQLKQHISEIFAAAQDKDTIQKSAVIGQEIDEAIKEQQDLKNEYTELLNNYKDVVVHSAFSPNKNEIGTNLPGSESAFDPDSIIANYLNDQNTTK